VYRWVDHTSEVELSVEAATEHDVFVDAMRGLAELLGEEPHGDVRRREVEVAASDRATALAEWLAELVYLSETDGFLPEQVAALELDDGALRATVEGRTATPRYLVKAVTYHGLELAPVGGRWRARVVLDV
jgi:SHS2 domain-containing protein